MSVTQGSFFLFFLEGGFLCITLILPLYPLKGRLLSHICLVHGFNAKYKELGNPLPLANFGVELGYTHWKSDSLEKKYLPQNLKHG